MGLFTKKQPVRAQAAGLNVKCLHCGNDHFWSRQIKLNSGASELLDLAWADQASTGLVCSVCGFVMEFMPEQLALERPQR